MGKCAINLDKQIERLRERGMIITDEAKAKEVLFDVGYYRLGFYWFPFECSYPRLVHRDHKFKENTNFDDAVKLYYFDFNLRSILLKYLSRVEINFRTILTYLVSNEYEDSPTWFVDPTVVNRSYIAKFDDNVYKPKFKRNPTIARHHRTHLNDRYAPAWKTVEFMTFGAVVTLYHSLNNIELKQRIAKEFHINRVEVFENYLNVILDIRNVCAHGNILFDYSPSRSIRRGPAMMQDVGVNQNLNGVLKVVCYFINEVSVHRYDNFIEEVYKLLSKDSYSEVVKNIIKKISGINIADYKRDCKVDSK